MQIFKLEYDWYEGDHGEILLGKGVEKKQFEKDLLKAKEFAESLIGKEIEGGDYLGKGYAVDCLPEYYQQIIWFLTSKLGYTTCNYNEGVAYHVAGSQSRKITITQSEKNVKRTELKC